MGSEVMFVDKLAMFILGVGAGIAWYRGYIIHILGKHPHTICHYCEFRRLKEIDYPPKCPPKCPPKKG